MIKIDTGKCNLCKLCVKVCHESCIKIDNNRLTINYDYCSTCIQCIAICPQQALSWNDIKPESFDKSLYPNPLQMDELFMERRTIRDYQDKKIDKELLQEIASKAIYAPTHNFNFRIIIIDDEEIIQLIDKLILKFSVRIYNLFYKKKIFRFLIKNFAPKREFEYLKAEPKLEKAKKRGKGYRSKPAAIIMIVGDKRVPLSLESAQYGLYNIDLYAQTKGLACRNAVGNQMIINRSKRFKNLIGLQKHEKIMASITLGFPAVKFRNKVVGKEIKIQWNANKN